MEFNVLRFFLSLEASRKGFVFSRRRKPYTSAHMYPREIEGNIYPPEFRITGDSQRSVCSHCVGRAVNDEVTEVTSLLRNVLILSLVWPRLLGEPYVGWKFSSPDFLKKKS